MNTENKLPEDFKQKWIAALRSGEYKQGPFRLHNLDQDTYCCLGVACRVVGISKDSLLGRYSIPKEPVFNSVPDVLRITGDEENPVVSELVKMNDGKNPGGGGGKSFKEIAKYIEHNL